MQQDQDSSLSCSSSSGELWGLPLMPSTVQVYILLPNGIFIETEVPRDIALVELKAKVWTIAKEYPLFPKLLEQKAYIFIGVTQDAECQQFCNEKQRLCDLHLFTPMLRLEESGGNFKEKIIKRDLSVAIGKCVNEFDRIKSREVDHFRYNVSQHCHKEVTKLNKKKFDFTSKQLLEQWLPPRMDSLDLPARIKTQDDKIKIRVWGTVAGKTHTMPVSIGLQVNCEAMSNEILLEAIKKFLRSNPAVFSHVKSREESKLSKLYVLKICGFNEYLVGNQPISYYKHIRQCICRAEFINLSLCLLEEIMESIPQEHTYLQPKISKFKDISTPVTSSSSIKVFFKVHVVSGAYVVLKGQDKICVYLNIFHGTTKLCIAQKTQAVSGTPKWSEWIEFNISICDIPRGAKLCLSMCLVKKKSEKDEYLPISWANISLFDFNGYLVQGKMTVHLWQIPFQIETALNPVGILGSNPCKDSQSVELEFVDYGYEVQYPLRYIIPWNELACPQNANNNKNLFDEEVKHLSQINEILGRGPLYELNSEERDLLWNSRKYCINVPHSLPKLLQSVNWHEKDEVLQIYTLLRQWKLLPPVVALELLDNKYPDPNVRNFATKCLENGLNNDDVLKYLLQLVTAIKHEPYLYNNLTLYLLTRAICNPNIGHYFFWHLKAEVHNPEVSLRYGLILESFLRSSGQYLNKFMKQTELLEKLMNLNSDMKKGDVASCKLLWDHLRKSDFRNAMQNLQSPINPTQILGSLLIDSCEVKGSAKRPFILHWENSDSLAENFEPNLGILFKNGDDLRQDQLTLQILNVMSEIWQNDDLDLFITPYKCISMGCNVGMIEIVQHAETLLSIQRKEGVAGSLQLKSSCLHQWLKNHNRGDQYEYAVKNFTLSCAGYCVATFILGIGDRHNDNIMVKKNGQMFHIDFGHFLNHKKKKYGFKRERVPFVLTDDFIKVICHGVVDPKKTKEYIDFQDTCVRAYISIRSKANLILNLLSLMVGAGIPELASYADLDYTRQALAVDVSEEEAVEDCLNIALNGQSLTHFDWACHAVRHGILKN